MSHDKENFSNRIMLAYDTIIVGMGAAGCSAASVLCKAGKRVLGLESQNRVGGRVNTVTFGDDVVELGAEWIHGDHLNSVYDLAIQNGVRIEPQNRFFQAFRSDGSNSNNHIVNDLVEFAEIKRNEHPSHSEPLGQFLKREIKQYMRIKYPKVFKDHDFVNQFLKFMELLINNDNASNTWNDITVQNQFEDLEGNLYLSWRKNGYKTLFEILLNTYKNSSGLPNLDIQYEKVVTRISYPKEPEEYVVITCEDDSSYLAKNVIVTVSLGVLKERYESMFWPPLPKVKVIAIDTISIGVVGKIILFFPYTWWRKESEFFAFIWKEKDKVNVAREDGWITKILGATCVFGSENALTLWTSGNVAKMVEILPDEVVKIKSMQLIRRFMGKNKSIPEPITVLKSNWYSNPYTRGSYTYDNLEMHPQARTILAEPLIDDNGTPRVLFAGEATNRYHFATVHGAIETGYREAYRLLPKLNNMQTGR